MPTLADQPVLVSPTAVQDQTDQKDSWVWGSVVLFNGASGEQNVFAATAATPTPKLGAASVVNPPPAWYVNGSKMTTNLVEASKLASLGSGSIRALGIKFPLAKVNPQGSGLAGINNYGATPYELLDIQDKCTFELKIEQKTEVIGGVDLYPPLGGPVGSISTTASNTTNSIATNGIPGQGKMFQWMPYVARTDTIEGQFKIVPQSTLAFIRTADEVASSGNSGQPVIARCEMLFSMNQDRR